MRYHIQKERAMKKIALSVAVAAMVVMSGCGDKKSESVQHETSAPAAKTETHAAAQPAEKKVEAAVSAPAEQKAKVAEEKPAAKEATPAEEAAAGVKEEAHEQAKAIVDRVASGEAEAEEHVTTKAEEAKTQIDVTTLYTKCAGCHGMKGEKHALGKSNVIAGQSREELVKKMKGYQAGTYGGPMKGLMNGQVKGLSDDEIDALAGYISSL